MNVMPKNKLYFFLSINILARSGMDMKYIGLWSFVFSIFDCLTFPYDPDIKCSINWNIGCELILVPYNKLNVNGEKIIRNGDVTKDMSIILIIRETFKTPQKEVDHFLWIGS